MNNDRKKAIWGVGWTTISTVFTIFAQLLRVVILTRLLVKSDFGIVAMVNVVMGFCSTFADLGFASVIMYKQKLEKVEFSTLYWVQFAVFVLIYVILIAISGLIGNVYDEPILKVLIPISALSIIFLGVGKLYDSVLQKRYEFKMLAIRNIVTNTVSLFLAVYLAYIGWGVYSLILSTLFQLFFYNAWNLIVGFKNQPVGFMFRLTKDSSSLLKMGIYQTLTRMLDFVSTKVDVMLIGGYLGIEALGVYDLAKELVMKLVNFIKSIVSSVALPFLSNNNTNDKLVVSLFYIVSKIVAFICFPICIVMAVFSKPIVQLMYGVDFIEAYPIVTLFSLMTMVNSEASYFDMLGIAKGRTDLNFYNTLIRVIVTVPIVWICCQFSIEYVALGHFLLAFGLFFVMWNIIARKTYNMSLREYFNQFSKLVYVLLPTSIVFYWCREYIFDRLEIITARVHVISFVVYLGLIIPLGFKFLKGDLVLIKNRFVNNKENNEI